MSASYVFLWIFIVASVVGTRLIWVFVRKISRDGWIAPKQSRQEQAQWEAQRRQAADDEHRRREQMAREASTAKRRREDARAKCELLYTVYAPEIGNRFSKQMLDAFIRNYMTDSHSPEEVEQRASQLEGILNQHRTAVRPTPRFRNIEELANWYVAEKQRIERLPVDDMFKEQHLVQLHTLYAEMTQQVLEQKL